MNEKDRVRRMGLVEGKSLRQTAKETGHSRNTIPKMVANSEVPQYTLTVKKEAPVLGPFKTLIDQWVAEDEKKPRKKRRTARRMYELLKQEYGYQGAESTLRWYVGQSRRQARHKVYVMLDYQPGEAAQMDFGEGEVIIAGASETVTAQLFLMWLGYSSATFMKAYPAQKQEMFFDGHVSAFAFFGGVSYQVWYDNLKISKRRYTKCSRDITGRSRRHLSASAATTCSKPTTATPMPAGRKAGSRAGSAMAGATGSCRPGSSRPGTPSTIIWRKNAGRNGNGGCAGGRKPSANGWRGNRGISGRCPRLSLVPGRWPSSLTISPWSPLKAIVTPCLSPTPTSCCCAPLSTGLS